MMRALRFPLMALMSVGLIACSTTHYDQNGLNAGPQNTGNTGRTVAEGAVIVGALGAGLGCAIAELSGGECGQGALIGGGAGIVTGAIAGSAVAASNQDFAEKEADLNAQTGIAREQVVVNNQAASAARRIADQHRATLARLNQQLAAGQSVRSQLNAELNQVRTDQRALDTFRGDILREIDQINQSLNRGGSPAQITQLRQQRDALQAQYWDVSQASVELGQILSQYPSAG